MTAISRSAQFVKLHKSLKKHYKPSPANAGRTVVEHLLFACCLEDAHHDAAEEAFAALVHTFFDWNEVRVTSISELSEVMVCLPDPRAAANRIKRVLHAVFEATFNFDLEDRRKKNLGPTVTWLEKLDGATRFTVAYVVQAALHGHSIPIDAGTMAVLRILDLVTDKDVAAGAVPGLERAVAKSKGIEFGSLLHELGADYSANAYSPSLRGILLQIDPECASRLPKRRAARLPQKTREPAQSPKAGKASDAALPSAEGKHKSAGPAEKPSARKKPSVPDAPPTAPVPEPSKKKAAAPHEPPAKHASAEKALPRSGVAKKRPASEGLSKRKPR
jgi:endonuclease III